MFALQGFDLLEELHVPESRGVRRVDGSQPEAVAYRINPSVHLRRTMRYRRLAAPQGLAVDSDITQASDAAEAAFQCLNAGLKLLFIGQQHNRLKSSFTHARQPIISHIISITPFTSVRY